MSIFFKLPDIPTPKRRIHEEDAVLSRRILEPGTAEYEDYYLRNPEKKFSDDKARSNPGLLSEGSMYYDPISFAAAHANFVLSDHLHALEQHHPSEKKSEVDASKISTFIKQWMLQNGAHSVGFGALEDYHLYSHKGRGPRKGETIKKDHPHAIAITVEMNHHMMGYAPEGPTVMESSQQYLNSGILATQLALFIKELGYRATAHTDGNYEVICPLVAADAGLGVLGRMGLLITPRLGPRVRIAVVTTDLPLKYSEKKPDKTIIDFCRRCKKCADNCPVAAIPSDDMQECDGVKRWQINSERCYAFWTRSGTDCGRCMISCPYSHPNNWFHNLIRSGIKNNLLFRIMAVKLDDLFYGRKPKTRRVLSWLDLKLKK